MRDWLVEQGWGLNQIFLDLDNLHTGDRWRQQLNANGTDCEAVVLCLSDNWLRSDECKREHTFAEVLGKPIMPVIVKPLSERIPSFITDLQFANIAEPASREAGFQKLKSALYNARIGPLYFPWPPPTQPNRAVYRGLQALDVQDAAIFFGRDADIMRGLDDLRRMRDGAPQRILVVLGASGAGKSSFLRAGLIPRLRRDNQSFLVLPVIRPERAAVSGAQGLAASISLALGDKVSLEGGAPALLQAFAELRTRVVERLASNAAASGEPYTAKPPTLILPVDQAEEMFGADNAEGQAYCRMIGEAIAADGNSIMVATIRSDAYEPLQIEPLFAATPQLLFSLPPLPAGAFQAVIEGPAALAKPPLTIEPALTQQLLSDLDAGDALPLLAFTMERLRSQCGDDGKLTLAEYRDKLGGLSGAIRSAIDAVLGVDPGKDKLAMARRLFVPALVQVDRDGVKRRVARKADIPADVRALADKFITQRLLVSDADKLEVAHEAILRQWPALASWINEERGALVALDGVRTAAGDWRQRVAGGRDKSSATWLLHRGERLKTAERIAARDDFGSAVDPAMRSYLAACRTEERRGTSRVRGLQALAVTAVLAVMGVGGAYMNREALEPVWAKYTKYWGRVQTPEALATMKAKATFQDCAAGSADCPLMVVIAGGSFNMGSADEDSSGESNQQPQHRVTVPRFAVSETEITFDDWGQCAANGGCRAQPRPADQMWGRGRQPVINVSWDDAQQYVRWLSEMTGASYRLLSEAEWEYAARAGTVTAFSFGDDDTDISEYAWFDGNSGGNPRPVRTRKPNAFGLYDMHGNVSEWVEDCYAGYDPGKKDALPVATDEPGKADNPCSLRVFRGGSWSVIPQGLRSAYRNWGGPSNRIVNLGFRVARTLASAP